MSVKSQFNYVPSPFLHSLQTGASLRGHHCPVGPADDPAARLSAVLPDQSEEEGQEGRSPGKTRSERWQRGRGRGFQTGWVTVQ